MKIIRWFLLFVLFLPISLGFGTEENLPYRHSMKVDDVSKSYTATEWIISPGEEPQDIK